VNLAQLRAFVSVAEAGSITGAGSALRITQSAVSHALASLETELDTRLVVRQRSGCVVTESGLQLVGHARDAVRAVERLTEEASAARGKRAGRLRVGAFPSVGQLLPPLLAQLNRSHPAVSVTLLEGGDDEVAEWLRAGIVDLAVVCSALTELVHQGVVRLPLRPRATRTLYLASRADVTLSPAARTLIKISHLTEESRPTA